MNNVLCEPTAGKTTDVEDTYTLILCNRVEIYMFETRVLNHKKFPIAVLVFLGLNVLKGYNISIFCFVLDFGVIIFKKVISILRHKMENLVFSSSRRNFQKSCLSAIVS